MSAFRGVVRGAERYAALSSPLLTAAKAVPITIRMCGLTAARQASQLPARAISRFTAPRIARVLQHSSRNVRHYSPQNKMTLFVLKQRTPWHVTAASVALLALLTLPPIGIYVLFYEPVMFTGRSRAVILSKEAEAELGKEAAVTVKHTQKVLPATDKQVKAVKAVALRIALAVEELLLEEKAKLLPPPDSVPVPASGGEEGRGEGRAGNDNANSSNHNTDHATKVSHPQQHHPRRLQPTGIHWLDNLLGLQHEFSWNWSFQVVDAPDVNAFCAPGGYVVVFTGLIHFIDEEVKKGNLASRECALATVLAHEIAHAVARHSAEKLSHAPLMMWVQALSASSPLLPYLFAFLFERPYSRTMELEADEIGLLLQSRACYDTSCAAGFYQSMGSTTALSHWISTHPSDELRAENAAAGSARLQLRQKTHCASLHADNWIERALTR